MKALFRKDLYVLTTALKSVILIWAVFPVVAAINPAASYFIVYVGLMAGTLSSTLISYEDKEKWPLFAGTLPISRKQIVAERYLFTLMLVAASTVIGGIVLLSYSLRGLNEYVNPSLLVQTFSTALVMPSLLLPVTYRYGVEKGRYLVMFLVIGLSLGSQALTTLFTGRDSMQGLTLPLIAVGCLVLFGISYLVSVRWYQNHDIS